MGITPFKFAGRPNPKYPQDIVLGTNEVWCLVPKKPPADNPAESRLYEQGYRYCQHPHRGGPTIMILIIDAAP